MSQLPIGIAPDKNQGASNSTKSLAVSLLSAAEVARYVEGCATLPDAIKTNILAMIDAAKKG